jgi:hypothetical protein
MERGAQSKTPQGSKQKEKKKKEDMLEHDNAKSTLASVWRRLAVLCRDSNAATATERERLDVLAADAGLSPVKGAYVDDMIAETLKTYMPLWETMLDAEPMLPWLADEFDPFPRVQKVLDALERRGHKSRRQTRRVDPSARIHLAVQSIRAATRCRSMASWPIDTEFGRVAHGWGRQPFMCSLIVLSGPSPRDRRHFAVVAPFVPRRSSSSPSSFDVALFVNVPNMPVACHHMDLLGRALGDADGDGSSNQSLSREVRRALTPDRFKRLGVFCADLVERNAPDMMGLRLVNPLSFIGCMLGLGGRAAAASTSLLAAFGIELLLARRVHVAHIRASDLVVMLAAPIFSIDRARKALARSSLRNAAARTIAREPAMGLNDETIATLDAESAALVAAHFFCDKLEGTIDGSNDMRQRVARALGARDEHENPLGTYRHTVDLNRSIILAISRRYSRH